MEGTHKALAEYVWLTQGCLCLPPKGGPGLGLHTERRREESQGASDHWRLHLLTSDPHRHGCGCGCGWLKVSAHQRTGPQMSWTFPTLPAWAISRVLLVVRGGGPVFRVPPQMSASWDTHMRRILITCMPKSCCPSLWFQQFDFWKSFPRK